MRKLKEQLTGNIAMVYHGSQEEEVYKYICEGQWKTFSGVYGKGLYSVYNLNKTNTQEGGYGDYILKLYIKDLSNYWCFNWDNFQKVHPLWAKHTNEDEFIDYQAEKFKLKDYPEELGNLYNNYKTYSVFLGTINGIIYHGTQDGDCILSYNPYNCRPIAVSEDKGKTWKKIDEEYVQQYKQTLSNPDLNKSFYKKFPASFQIIIKKISNYTSQNECSCFSSNYMNDKFTRFLIEQDNINDLIELLYNLDIDINKIDIYNSFYDYLCSKDFFIKLMNHDLLINTYNVFSNMKSVETFKLLCTDTNTINEDFKKILRGLFLIKFITENKYQNYSFNSLIIEETEFGLFTLIDKYFYDRDNEFDYIYFVDDEIVDDYKCLQFLDDEEEYDSLYRHTNSNSIYSIIKKYFLGLVNKENYAKGQEGLKFYIKLYRKFETIMNAIDYNSIDYNYNIQDGLTINNIVDDKNNSVTCRSIAEFINTIDDKHELSYDIYDLVYYFYEKNLLKELCLKDSIIDAFNFYIKQKQSYSYTRNKDLVKECFILFTDIIKNDDEVPDPDIYDIKNISAGSVRISYSESQNYYFLVIRNCIVKIIDGQNFLNIPNLEEKIKQIEIHSKDLDYSNKALIEKAYEILND